VHGGARRRRLLLAGAVSAVMFGLVAAGWMARRPGPQLVSDTVACDSGGYRLSSIDPMWTDRGSHTSADALAAFLSTRVAEGLPRTGYSARHQLTYQSGAVVAPLDGVVDVHRTAGQIDVVLEVEVVRGAWQVSQARACA